MLSHVSVPWQNVLVFSQTYCCWLPGSVVKVGLLGELIVEYNVRDCKLRKLVHIGSKDVMLRNSDLGPPSIFAASRALPLAWGSKDAHLAFYIQDVYRFRRPCHARIPLHYPYKKRNYAVQTLRVMSWNVNNLCGLMSSFNPGDHLSPPEDFAEVIRWLKPDVIVLQEMVTEARCYNDVELSSACSRVKYFEGLLEAGGFSLCKSTGGNLTLLATKLVITEMESFNLAAFNPGRQPCYPRDARRQKKDSHAAAYVQVALGGGKELGIYATHCFDRSFMQSCDASRVAAMRVLLDHQALRKDVAALVVADFNEAHKRDYSPEDWDIIVGSSVDDVVADDGVDHLLQQQGFKVCWDLAGNRNFPGIGAPPLTHSSGTTVDHIYLQSNLEFLKLDGAFVGFTSLSDHLPVVVDITIDCSR